MIDRVVALLGVLLLAACAIRAPSPQAFSFGVMGDTPYSEREEPHFIRMIERMDAEPLAFVVHVGDFKSGASPCTDALFEKRKAQFNASRHALIYTPGDNEWTDCRGSTKGAMEPIERLARLRQVFFPDAWSLGREPIETAFQGECIERSASACTCPPHPENRLWTRAGIVFVTLNIPGSNNNVGFDRANDAEARCRNEANRRWLERAVGESERDNARGLAVFIQADPWITRAPVYKAFLAQIQEAASRLRKPVLFVHGDTHTYRLDMPFKDSMGNAIPNLTRLEVYGSPVVGWVKVMVDPEYPDLFRFEPHAQAFVP